MMMPLLSMLLVSLPAPTPVAPACRASQLRLSLIDDGGGATSHDGIVVVLRNAGSDCTLPALPEIHFTDSRGHILDAARQAPVGMHPGPVMVPLRLGGGHRATTELSWVSAPVYEQSRKLSAHRIIVEVGGHGLSAPIAATLYGPDGKSVGFQQPPFRAEEGMAAG
jgi:hypothetical protein